jgi:hypothetical protein
VIKLRRKNYPLSLVIFWLIVFWPIGLWMALTPKEKPQNDQEGRG